MTPIVVTVGPLVTAAANNIAQSQTPNAGAITLNGTIVTGGVAILDKARQVLFTFAASEVGHNFVLVGTNWAGDAIGETVAGTGIGTVATVLSYKTVSSVTISANATGAIQIGTNGVAASPWVRMDGWANPSISLACVVSGTANYTVQQTMDDPNSPTSPVNPNAMTWQNFPDLALVAASATMQATYTFVPQWIRVILNSGTGSVTTTILQTGDTPY
jgi:hypothetical protein